MFTAMTNGASTPEEAINSAEALYLKRLTTSTHGPEPTDSRKPVKSDEGEAAVQPDKHQFTPQTNGERNTLHIYSVSALTPFLSRHFPQLFDSW
jgi:hypothetical protein